MPYTPRAPRDSEMCLKSIGARICVAALDHSGEHHLVPLPKPGKMTSNDLYLAGVREGVNVRRTRVGNNGVHMKVSRVFSNGIILLRSMNVGQVFLMTGETFFRNFFIMR